VRLGKRFRNTFEDARRFLEDSKFIVNYENVKHYLEGCGKASEDLQ
jgi:hypothetical protein